MAYTDSTFSNPVTKAGRVVYNVCLDLDHARYRAQKADGRMRAVDNVVETVTPEHLTVQPHELCLIQDDTIFRRGLTRSVNDSEVLLLSALNGLKTDGNNLKDKNADARRRAVRSKLRFGGVAATKSEYDPSTRIANDAVFVSQFGGLCTILNTGDQEIKAGQFVQWDLPARPGEGTNMCGLRDKQMVITRPYNERPTAKRIELIRKELGKDGDRSDDTVAQIHQILTDDRTRIIGRAMTNAQTGETFDLLLGRYCC